LTTARLDDDFFRHEYGRLVATLSRRVGVKHVEAVEDAVQGALMTAFESWPTVGLLESPSVWLFRVAHNRLLDELRQQNRRQGLLEKRARERMADPDGGPAQVHDEQMEQDLLGMLFVCCDEAIPQESALVLALKTLCGFDVREISFRLFITEANVYKTPHTPKPTSAEILGVVKDFHFAGIHQNIEPLVMMPLGQQTGGTVVARVQTGRVSDAIRAAEAVWASVYPDYPSTYSFMDEEFQQIYESDRATGKVINIFASLAILIACLGLFGLVSFSTTQRTKEIGVRKALGASSPSVVMLLILDFARWVVLANLIALPLAWVVSSRWLSGFAYHVEVDLVVLGIASLATLAIAVLTVVLQSWKTANMNPVMALRHE
jgi:RNA polymerase sigma factor (sigma-70 family)